MGEYGQGDRVRFKKASTPTEYVVEMVHSNGEVDLNGPHRMRLRIDPARLELIAKALVFPPPSGRSWF